MEERLKFVASGTKPRKNKDAMAAVLNELKEEGLFYGDNKKAVGKNSGAADAEMETDEDEAPKKSKKDKKAAKKEKKEKKEKKSKKEESAGKKRKRSKVDSDDEQDDDSD